MTGRRGFLARLVGLAVAAPVVATAATEPPATAIRATQEPVPVHPVTERAVPDGTPTCTCGVPFTFRRDRADLVICHRCRVAFTQFVGLGGERTVRFDGYGDLRYAAVEFRQTEKADREIWQRTHEMFIRSRMGPQVDQTMRWYADPSDGVFRTRL